MKHKTIDINTKWLMLYKSYKRATGKRKILIREKLFELLVYNAIVVKFNKDNI